MKRLAWLVLCGGLCCTVACGDDDGDDHDHGHDAGDSGPGRDSGPEQDAARPMDGGEDSGMSDPVARGDYLVNHVAACVDCHTPRNPDGSFDQSRALSGVECFVEVAPDNDEVGCLNSRNLTNHETGLMNRSDDEIKDLFLRGLRPDGKALHPVMPYYVLGNMSEGDADAIVAYLRTVPGVDHMLPPSQPPFASPDEPAPRWPEAQIPMPVDGYPERDAALRGRYLAGNIGICMECHTAAENDAPVIDKAFQGGRSFESALLGLPPIFPATIYSPNITPHATGIADWGVDDIVAAIKDGEDFDQDGAPLCPPMPAGPMGAFGGITDGDARDIAHYLLSIPAGDNEVAQDCIAMPPEPLEDGGTDDAG